MNDGSMDVGRAVRQAIEAHPAFAANPIGDWGDIVGEQVAHYSHPVKLKDKSLLVIAFDSVWKHHLELNKEVLLAKINEGRKHRLVEKITVRVGEIPESDAPLNPHHELMRKSKAKATRQRKPRKVVKRKLTPEEDALVRSIEDPELKALGAKLLQHTD